MLIFTTGPTRAAIAGALFLVLAPLSASAQRAASQAAAPAADATGPPPFLQAILEDLAPEPVPRVLQPHVAKAFNEAITALNAKKYDEARAFIGELSLEQLSSFERGRAELALYLIAQAEEKLGEARQHLVNALESGGLSNQETTAVQNDIKRVDARLATVPPA